MVGMEGMVDTSPAKLQRFDADHKNRKEGQGFYKMEEKNIELL